MTVSFFYRGASVHFNIPSIPYKKKIPSPIFQTGLGMTD
jgi:hypothetical protein